MFLNDLTDANVIYDLGDSGPRISNEFHCNKIKKNKGKISELNNTQGK